MASEHRDSGHIHQTETGIQKPKNIEQHRLQMRRNSVIVAAPSLLFNERRHLNVCPVNNATILSTQLPHNPLMAKGELTHLICIHIEPIQKNLIFFLILLIVNR